MRSLKEETSGLRVLMRMPDLSPTAAATPVLAAVSEPERETFVQVPLAPLSAAAPGGKKKTINRPETQGVMPEELKRPGRLNRALTALAVLALAAAIGIALSNRTKQDEPAPIPAEIAAAIVPEVPGGKPTEITQIPEISFPAEATSPAETEAMKIQRLPTVEEKASTAQAAANGATANVSDDSAVGQTTAAPGVARLSSRIEQPQPQVSR